MKRSFSLFLALLFFQLRAQTWQWLAPLDSWAEVCAMDASGKVHFFTAEKFFEVDASGNTETGLGFLKNGAHVIAAHFNSKGNLVLAGSISDTVAVKDPKLQWFSDIFIAEFTSAGAPVWNRIITGKNHQLLTDMYLDSGDNVLFTAVSNGTIEVDGKPIFCRTAGSCVAGKISPSGQILWMNADSSDTQEVKHVRLSVNEYGESLISISSKGGTFYHFNNAYLIPATGTSYYYGDEFLLMVDPGGKVVWHRSEKLQKWLDRQYCGFAATSYYQVNSHFSNGDYYADLLERDFYGDTLTSFSGKRDTNNFINYLNTVDGKTYFLISYWRYAEGGAQRFNNTLCIKEGNAVRTLASFSGETRSLRLFRHSDGQLVLSGLYLGELKMGDHTANSGSTWKGFAAALDSSPVGLSDQHDQETISLNPCPATDRIEVRGCTHLHKIEITDLYGRRQDCRTVNNSVEISNLPAGVYLLRITKNAETRAFRFVKI